MARRKRQKGPAKKQQKQVLGSAKDAETKAKLQAAARKRRRQPKGSVGGGRFAPGGGSSFHAPGEQLHLFPVHGPMARTETRAGKTTPVGYRGPTTSTPGQATGASRRGRGNPKGGRVPRGMEARPTGVPFGTSGSHGREVYNANRAEAKGKSKRQNERDAAYYKTRTQTGLTNIGPPDADESTVRVTHHDVRQAEMARRDATWRKGRGTFQQPGAQEGKFTSPTQFIREEAPPSMVKQLEKDIDNPRSWLNAGLRGDQMGTARLATRDSDGRPAIRGRLSPAQRDRLERMTKGLQQGDQSYEELAQQISSRRPGRQPGAKVESRTAGARTTDVKQTLESRGARKGRRGKYDSTAPKKEEIQVGLSAQHVDKISDLARMMPNLTDRDLVKLQQGQREQIWSQQIERNARWAQETRAANMRDAKPGERRDSNRVVFFTTSLGAPAPSVPSNSLIGQYIIRRRKKMLLNEGVVNERDVKGNFPDAVRDMHIVEASTGVSLGAQGDVGAFRRVGFRVGSHKSPGYGKPVPVGSQILYDRQGRPMYDANGNIRYSEGATRRFNVTTPDLGFRVFIG